MYKFIITQQLAPGALEKVREAAVPCQQATRREEGCISYDFYTSIDDPEKMVFVECFKSKQAHEWHCEQQYVKDFLKVFEPLSVGSTFELIDVTAD